MTLNLILGALALLSLALMLWQWLAGRRFPLHQRVAAPSSPPGPSTLRSQAPLTLLKPLKGSDPATEDCLRSWFAQQYAGPIQILFGVAAAADPVCAIVRQLLEEFPDCDAQLVVCGPPLGANAKVSQLAQLEQRAKHELLVISDADVRVPPDLLANLLPLLLGSSPPADPREPRQAGAPTSSRLSASIGTSGTSGFPVTQSRLGVGAPAGLACCFYRLANPTNLAMQWEVIAINADFWSQVLMSLNLKPLDFALGAVMATRRKHLEEIGGFQALADCLADDYQLGNRLARRGYRIALCPVVVECWSVPMSWREVWKHQLRWARTIRVCQPVPYFFSILSNATLWPLLWLAVKPPPPVLALVLGCWLVRLLTAIDLQSRLSQTLNPEGRASPRAQTAPETQDGRASVPASPDFPGCLGSRGRSPSPAQGPWRYAWLIPAKDLLQAVIWLLAFLGNRVEWRGERMRLRRDGTLERL